MQQAIRVCPFKGTWLSRRLYGTPEARVTTDLDFIVHAADLDRARSRLATLGYHGTIPPGSLQDRYWRRSGWGYDLTSRTNGLTVEIKSRVAPDVLPWNLPSNQMWDMVEWVPRDPLAVPCPRFRPELLLLLLSVHGMKHFWSHLCWLLDICAILTRYRAELDWDLVTTLAQASGTCRPLAVAVQLATETFDRPDLLSYAERIGRRQAVQFLVEHCRRHLLATSTATHWRRDHWMYLRNYPGILQQARQAARLLLRPGYTDVRVFPLGRFFPPVYSLLHPMRMLKQAIKTPMQMNQK